MKQLTLSFLFFILCLTMNAQMANGRYTYFSGDWQIKFEVADDGKSIPSLELTDLKSNKATSGKGSWHMTFFARKNEKGEVTGKGEDTSHYEVIINDETFSFKPALGGALMFEFPDGKKVGMKEKK